MVKLLKNEWKRYGKVIIAIAIGAAAAAVLDAVCIMIYGSIEELDIMSMMTVCMLTFLIVIMPVAAFIFPVISYAVDISRRGLLFLTPVPVWLAILTKVLFGMGAGFALCLESQGIIALLTVMAEVFCRDTEITEVIGFMSALEFGESGVIVSVFTSLASTVTTAAHASLSVMAAISLARFAVSNTGGCVVLSIVFSYLINIIESMIAMLISYLTEKPEFILGAFAGLMNFGGTFSAVVAIISSIIYSGIFYAICTGLTSKKINLA